MKLYKNENIIILILILIFISLWILYMYLYKIEKFTNNKSNCDNNNMMNIEEKCKKCNLIKDKHHCMSCHNCTVKQGTEDCIDCKCDDLDTLECDRCGNCRYDKENKKCVSCGNCESIEDLEKCKQCDNCAVISDDNGNESCISCGACDNIYNKNQCMSCKNCYWDDVKQKCILMNIDGYIYKDICHKGLCNELKGHKCKICPNCDYDDNMIDDKKCYMNHEYIDLLDHKKCAMKEILKNDNIRHIINNCDVDSNDLNKINYCKNIYTKYAKGPKYHLFKNELKNLQKKILKKEKK